MKLIIVCSFALILVGCCKAELKPAQISIYGNETTSGDSLMSINFADNEFTSAEDTTFMGVLSAETSLSLLVFEGDAFKLFVPGSSAEYSINGIEIDYRGRCAQKIKKLTFDLNGTATESELITISN